MRAWRSSTFRAVAIALPFALAFAPVLRAHGSPFPAWFVFFAESSKRPEAVAAVLLTWAVLTGIVRLMMFAGRSAPAPLAIVSNASLLRVAVHLQTDVGESYDLGVIQAGETVRLSISGGNKLVWLSVAYADGRTTESQKIATRARGIVTATIGDQVIGISTL